MNISFKESAIMPQQHPAAAGLLIGKHMLRSKHIQVRNGRDIRQS